MAAAFQDEEEALLLLALHRRRRRNGYGRSWVHDINLSRAEKGEFYNLVQDLRKDEDRFFTYFRMTIQEYDHLVDLLHPVIGKKHTNYRRCISTAERLAMTLRFLAHGDSFTIIAFNYRVGVSTLGEIVEETCTALWDTLVGEYLPAPTQQTWEHIAQRFRQQWQFPNCIGALDGKHCVIQAPPNSGSQYFNYKGGFSIVLMALVDADYAFIIVDIGKYGRNSDGGILRESVLGQTLANNSLHVPPPTELLNAPEYGALPHVIVGDPAFPLKTYLMRPYPGKNLPDEKLVFNYRLSRARRISENAFGILSQRWRVYQRRLNLHHDRAVQVIKATVVLHNYLQKANVVQANLDQNGLAQRINGGQANALQNIPGRQMAGNRAKKEAKVIRDKFKDYFCSPVGEIPYQYDIIRRA